MRSSRGFTLIELLVVIAIIGILSSVVLASLNTSRGKARDARRLSDLRQIRTALELYASENGGYPGTVSGNDLPPTLATYIGPVPADPGGNGGAKYEYGGAANAAATSNCAATPCSSYVLKITMENTPPVGGLPAATYAGGIGVGVDCAPAGSYCVKP